VALPTHILGLSRFWKEFFSHPDPERGDVFSRSLQGRGPLTALFGRVWPGPLYCKAGLAASEIPSEGGTWASDFCMVTLQVAIGHKGHGARMHALQGAAWGDELLLCCVARGVGRGVGLLPLVPGRLQQRPAILLHMVLPAGSLHRCTHKSI
jgi:hypothetical protein